MPPSPPKTILITGCSAQGIGAALAQQLAQEGHVLFATARTPSKIPAELREQANVHVLALDVTDAASIAAAVHSVTEHTSTSGNHRGLDVLINNAGTGYTMPLAEADLARARAVYEANVWGPLQLIQAFQPLLVAARGRIVNLSSVGAVVPTPWIGVYASSKAALVQLSETLRLELQPCGVGVVCVMAGTVATAFHANEPEVLLPPASWYAPIRRIIADWATGRAGPRNGSSPDEFAKVLVEDVVLAETLPAGAAARLLARWCPVGLLDRIMKNGQGIDELTKSLEGGKK
ncbi:SDR family oxidoreductase [Aspergillus brunneoviolaceus CBS 621.78]|uniref:Oxidoreductase n=1 Tax=Aspergillus brunneoviolaceus CBS 621.78 TaxID=1450534 RepID=A0ACD1G385_9EURO|nr:oxidoreductase [Aspergillus brunneoviolaceus CBS 621.78]RAH43705.1 oxidoreductase [Aspergillus brunneoviolaceus CBS 621.78]